MVRSDAEGRYWIREKQGSFSPHTMDVRSARTPRLRVEAQAALCVNLLTRSALFPVAHLFELRFA